MKAIGTAIEIAKQVRAKIRSETGLTASAGVSYNKFLAKLASDHNKPDGLFVITPNIGTAFVENLPVGRFHGVGPATTAKMNRLGIETRLDLRAQTMLFLQQHFGKSGPYFYWIARGIDERPVRADRVRKSIGGENTFAQDIFTFDADALAPILEKVWHHCETARTRGRTVTLKVKYAEFQQITRSLSLPRMIEERNLLERASLDLLRCVFPMTKGVRLLGISLSTLSTLMMRTTRNNCRSTFETAAHEDCNLQHQQRQQAVAHFLVWLQPPPSATRYCAGATDMQTGTSAALIPPHTN